MTMPKFLTIDRLNEREEGWERRNMRELHRRRYRPPTDDERLFTSAKLSTQCLSHITRHVADLYRVAASGELVYRRSLLTGWCGSQQVAAVLVPLADETFACHSCIATAERHGGDTFSLIPTTGCEVTEGQRWRPRRLQVAR